MSPFFAVALFVSLLFCGLSLDYGMLVLTKMRMQTAADAAANAFELQFERADVVGGIEAGAAAASQHGFTSGVNGTTLTYVATDLLHAVQTGPYAGQYDGLQLQISQQVPTYFMRIVNSNLATVTVNSVAVVPACQYYLGTKGLSTPTVSLSSGAQTFANCSAYVSGGLSEDSSGWWQAWQTYLTGGSGASSISGRLKSGATYNAPSRTDPLSSVSQPSVSSCTANNTSVGNLHGSAMTLVLNPGVYCGSVSGSTVTPGLSLFNGTVTLNPGLYIVTGGINWQRVNVTGRGVTLFFTNVSGTSKYGSILITDLSNLYLYAPTTGTFGSPNSTYSGALSGLVFFVDRGWVNTTSQDFNINSSAATTSGVWYLPDTGLQMFNGSWGCYVQCGVVADNLVQTNWENDLNSENFASISGGNPFNRGSVLVQ